MGEYIFGAREWSFQIRRSLLAILKVMDLPILYLGIPGGIGTPLGVEPVPSILEETLDFTLKEKVLPTLTRGLVSAVADSAAETGDRNAEADHKSVTRMVFMIR